ncbi:MAG TPA: tRNA (N6-threonylcarbamoyladenosine(37)-N6)-methyltransferase TrmO [Methanothrix sp.]|jgi:formylmethanofuran dehydrogenase subunit E|nr:tRNA (N6-threonylcarbamoyladenosine(37)-N6)-methyltransferase TrmO [Methanothrix sp.]HNR57074.1 tRNA (N6-threonylcarbamoyladenosine(37)-N6)-methyltransferase TrmO [Methanothrix sp.]HOI69799.1 tRNA (N6-threonylcarbamoyladenosine(37)-N6)-methyltransferase TrmO [Methanothrix sp.]HPY71698.1 tRNA (N6-threonylcarbamoyladenosine(37)-N6)-methyltransferase TrmO [Methanothrix sp.]HQA61363.1 tRNA (N6-threonylcarbamoyladenosine(37)-N6)-methyltransferase TrmO [Methanothrix sp.]
MNLKPIGVIHSPYKTRAEAPFQGRPSEEVSEVEVFDEFLPGLADVEGCTHLFLLYWLDRADRKVLKAFPPHDGKEHGVFATRSPNRPNPIGLGIVDLVGVAGGRLRVRGLDALEGTPLLDIKPYFSEVDSIPDASVGWRNGGESKRNDGR